MPAPTHSRYHSRNPERLDEGVLPWVSMAEALDWGMTARPYPTIATGTSAGGGTDPDAVGGSGGRKILTREREAARWAMQGGVSGEGKPRPDTDPAPTIGAKATMSFTDDPDDWYGRERRLANDAGEDWTHLRGSGYGPKKTIRPVDTPSPTVAFGKDGAAWEWQRPATTVQGDSRIWPPGHKINQRDIDRIGEEAARERYGDRGGKKARRITIEEAKVLQGFPADYELVGSKTSQFRQIGNAVPPPLAEVVLKEALGDR